MAKIQRTFADHFRTTNPVTRPATQCIGAGTCLVIGSLKAHYPESKNCNFSLMKWYYLLSLILIAFSTFCQSSVESRSEDTSKVQSLIKLSKEFQWKDSYKSIDYADEALTLARKLDFQKGIAISSNIKAFCFWSFGDNDLAIQFALEALEIGKEENDLGIQAESYYILARGYSDLNELSKSQEFIVKAANLARQGNNWEQLCSIYNLMGVIKSMNNQKDSALHYFKKAFEIGELHAVTPINFPRIISNIGTCYTSENPRLAFTYFNRALALAKETNNQIADASINDVIGHAYLKVNDLNRAEIHLQAALQLARKLGLRRVIQHAYAGLVDIELKHGRGDEAVVYLQRYYAVRDSLLNTTKMRQIVELEAKHALQLKEQNIKILENEKRLQTIWKNILIVLMIFFIFLSAGLYQLQQYRHRKNREMLNLEIDYLTQQHRETVDKYKTSISLLKEPDEPLESHDHKLLKKAILIVENNLHDPQFGVEKMAVEMNMSRTNMHRKIKSITGFPPSELIRSIRLRKAAKLILNKVDSVTQIALLVGFDDYSHFSKTFKKHFGVSPSSYEERSNVPPSDSESELAGT
jgi:AraC-like DNA-binding protein